MFPIARIIVASYLCLSATTLHARIEAEDNDFNTAAASLDDSIVVPQSGEWISFDNVNFTGASAVTVRAARGAGSAQMIVRIDSPTGPSLGSKTVDTGGWRTFQNFSYPTGSISGVHKLYILAGNPDKPVIQNVKVNGSTAFNKNALLFDDMAPNLFNRDFYFVALQSAYARYDAVDFTNVTSLVARVANGTTGTLTFRLDNKDTGAKIATINTTNTGWRTFVDYTESLSGITGVHDLYVIATGGHGGVIDYFDLKTGTVTGGNTITMTGSTAIPVNNQHDGGFRPVVGVQEHALMRPTNNVTTAAGALSGHGVVSTRFNHHPFLTYWGGRFWAYYIGYQTGESTKAGYLHWSTDGRTWDNENKTKIFPSL